MAAYGLYTHIAANRVRSLILLAGLFLLVYVLVFAVALGFEGLTYQAPSPVYSPAAGVWIDQGTSLAPIFESAWADLLRILPWASLGAAVWIVIAYFWHQSLIDGVTGGHSVTREEQPRLYNLLENLCISRGIPMPKLKVMENDALNAFATGLNQRQYSITVTSALLDKLNDAEMEAVLGHELTHIRNGDVRMIVIAGVIAGIVAFTAEMFFRSILRGGMRFGGSGGRSDNKKGGGGIVIILIAVALIAVAWLLSVVVRLAISRSREYLADAGSVELTKNPDAMISALRKIENRGEIVRANSAIMEMCIDNPRGGFADIFATHPSIDRRVGKLVTLAGGHDIGQIDVGGVAPISPKELLRRGTVPRAG
jgi:heat shock protein HtpX